MLPIIVNDGSGPGYDDIFDHAAEYGMVLSHTENRGKGAALKTGLAYVQNTQTTPGVIVTLDADGQHTAKDAAALCAKAEKRPDTLFLGSRSLRGGTRVPLRSRFGNSITRAVFRLRTGVRVYDTQTGLRAFSSGLIPLMMKIGGDRYEYEISVLLYFADHGMKMEEIPIQTIYIGKNESSHFDAVRDSIRIYRAILKRRDAVREDGG